MVWSEAGEVRSRPSSANDPVTHNKRPLPSLVSLRWLTHSRGPQSMGTFKPRLLSAHHPGSAYMMCVCVWGGGGGSMRCTSCDKVLSSLLTRSLPGHAGILPRRCLSFQKTREKEFSFFVGSLFRYCVRKLRWVSRM